jgi:hypothetical protein
VKHLTATIIFASVSLLAAPAFAADKPAIQSGNVTLDLLSSDNVQGCEADAGILALNPEDIPTPIIYGGTMTGAFGKHDVALDIYIDQGLLNQSDEGCQEAYAVLCTPPEDALNLNMAADLSICNIKAGDTANQTITGSLDLATLSDAAVEDAWGSLTGTIEPAETGVTRLKAKIKAVVQPAS